jgi:hypothetical protein
MLPEWFQYQKQFFDKFCPRTLLRVLQIGAYKGDATLWLLQNREVEFVHDVDLWEENGEIQHLGLSFSEVETLYDSRFKESSKVKKFKMSSDSYFRFAENTFNFIYIDGDHRAVQTAIDGLNSWRLLERGGIMVFDDYGWDINPSEYMRPKRGIDAVLQVCEGHYSIVEKGYQVWIEKL